MKFKIGKTKKLFDGKFISLWAREFIDGAGKRQIWEFIRKNDVVAIFPVTDDGKVVLIKNYRVPLQKYVIETPAGLTDKLGESREELAKRELLEEAGYTASKFYPLPPYPFKAGESAHMTYCFVATGLKKVRNKVGDNMEDISIMEVPFEELTNLYLRLPDGVLFDIATLGIYEAARALKIVP